MEDLHREVVQAIECLIMTREKKVQNRQAIANKLAQDVSSADNKWTITQLHIVSLINRHKDVNNTFLANELKISKPAVSKAIHILIQYAIVIAHKNEGNNKETFYSLTSEGVKLATIHDKMHEITKEKYLKLLNKFSDSELKIIIRFLDEWAKQI